VGMGRPAKSSIPAKGNRLSSLQGSTGRMKKKHVMSASKAINNYKEEPCHIGREVDPFGGIGWPQPARLKHRPASVSWHNGQGWERNVTGGKTLHKGGGGRNAL